MRPDPVILVGTTVRLEPLTRLRAADLLVASSYDEIWTYLDEPTPRTIDDMYAMIDQAEIEQKAGERLPFSVVDISTDLAIGSTSYIDIKPAHRSLEIGWTWLTPDRWGQGVTTEASYLLLRHAFEVLGAVRVAMKADVRNERSRRAIASMGAIQEGIFRKHRILSNGYQRDSVYFSIIDTEWPAVRSRLSRLAHER